MSALTNNCVDPMSVPMVIVVTDLRAYMAMLVEVVHAEFAVDGTMIENWV